MDELAGRTAVVTGAASGIGLAIVEAFVGVGTRVVMADVNEAALHEHASRLRNSGAEVHPVSVDVRDSDAVERLAAVAVDVYGELNIAVNNAGIVLGGNTWEIPLEDWHRVIDIDFWGVVHGIRAFVPRILASNQPGHVVNVASMAAVYVLPKLGPYAAAKHAVLAVSDVLAAELDQIGAPVGVSVVMPGRIKTGMNPIGTIPASAVATNVLDAIRRGRRYVFTDHDHVDEVDERLRAVLAARDDVVS